MCVDESNITSRDQVVETYSIGNTYDISKDKHLCDLSALTSENSITVRTPVQQIYVLTTIDALYEVKTPVLSTKETLTQKIYVVPVCPPSPQAVVLNDP